MGKYLKESYEKD